MSCFNQHLLGQGVHNPCGSCCCESSSALSSGRPGSPPDSLCDLRQVPPFSEPQVPPCKMGLLVINASSELCDWLIHGRSRKSAPSFRVTLGLITAESSPSQLPPSLGSDVTGMSSSVLHTCETQKQNLKASHRCFHLFLE